jgi:serine/threonine-protein kinase
MELVGQIGTYYVDEQTPFQQGKFAQVFRGVNAQQQPVLVKRISSTQHSLTDLRRFKREYDFRVQHPNMLAAIDYVVHEKIHYLVRPWVDGKDLSKQLRKYSYRDCLSIITAVLDALEALHLKRVLHMDIQPKNIIVGSDKHIWLTDLGLAVEWGKVDNYRQPFSLYYAAPEQVLNYTELFQPSTDLYAVGMLLLELLTGTKPYQHQNPELLMNLVLAAPIPQTNLPKPWVDFITKATAKPRFLVPPTHYEVDELRDELLQVQQQRFQTASTFKEALLALPPIQTPWWKFGL